MAVATAALLALSLLATAVDANAAGPRGTGTLTRSGYTLTGYGLDPLMQFYEPAHAGGASELYLLSDSPETLDKEYSVGADQSVPGICTDPETSFVEVCGLLSSPTFTLTATAGPDNLAPVCVNHGPINETGFGSPCAPTFYVKGEAGDDTLEALFHDARTSMDLDCGEGNDTVVNVQPNDLVHHNCEHVPDGAHYVEDPVPTSPTDGGKGELGGNSGQAKPLADPIVKYAPELVFHTEEERWPGDPTEFVKHSSLKWNNESTCGNSARTVTIAKTGQVNMSKLASGGYKYRACRLVAKSPRHGTPSYKVWNTRELVSPSCGGCGPPGTSGFYLDLDNKYRVGKEPARDHGPPIYVEYKPRRYILYWLFSNQNNATGPGVKDIHEGDWEHIVVRLDKENHATSVAYYQHLCDGEVQKFSDLRLVDGTHPTVYVARGSHASYPTAGFTAVSCPPRILKGVRDYANDGLVWDPWASGSDGFRMADKQKWYGFGGGWGSNAGGGAWGPLGPGPLKYDDNALPKGW